MSGARIHEGYIGQRGKKKKKKKNGLDDPTFHVKT
jgi:hypothetical protein